MNHLAVALLGFFFGNVPKEVVDMKLHRFLKMRCKELRLTVRQLMGERESAGKSILSGSAPFSISLM